jgi:hypothetical protein
MRHAVSRQYGWALYGRGMAKVKKGNAADGNVDIIRICNECNSTRTQPHDFAWEILSARLNGLRPRLSTGTEVRGNRVFPYDTTHKTTNVHLYFAKLFGGMIVEGGGPLAVQPFAKAIMTGRPHPEVYLQLGAGDGTVGWSNLNIGQMPSGNYIAVWLYLLDRFFMHVVYAQAGAPWERLGRLSHSKFSTNKMRARDFTVGQQD